jgi:cation diffusion facilitator CzcD-associated flavoprotein CzcO
MISLSVVSFKELITACVEAMNAVGGTWWGTWVDRKRYPTELRLVGDGFFASSLSTSPVSWSLVRSLAWT